MRKILIRGITLLLCVCTFATGFGIVETQAATNKEYQFERISDNYSESFLYSTYYQDLTRENGYLYKTWAKNVEEKNIVSKSFAWCSSMLLGRNLNKDAYVDYLCSLMSMVENGFAENLNAQASYTNKLSIVDRATELVGIACSDLIPIRSDELKAACSFIGESVGLIDEVISDVNMLGTVAVATTFYEQKITILNAIIENTSDSRLKDAANDVMQICDAELLCIIADYTNDIAGNLISLDCELFGTTWYNEIASVLLSPARKESIKNKITSTAPKFLKNVAGAVAKASSLYTFGFSVGVYLMKQIYSETAEYYREMTAMDRISDALIVEMAELKTLADSTADPEVQYEHIRDYVAIAKGLVFVHLRGEYCNVESRTGNKKEGADEYYAKVVAKLGEHESAVSDILVLEDLHVVNDEFSLHGGFIKEITQKTTVPDGYIGIYSYSDLQRIIDNQPELPERFNEYVMSNYILMSDITLPGDYKSLNVFAGVFDGNGYCISNISQPLFETLADAKVMNLALSVSYRLSDDTMDFDYGALTRFTNSFTTDGKIISSGYNEGHNEIDNCYVTGSININFNYGDVGGLVGKARYMEITNCYNKAIISVTSRQGGNVGGLVGMSGKMYNCFNAADISVHSSVEGFNTWGNEVIVGGISGCESEVRHCYNSGSLSATVEGFCRVWAGGIVGWSWITCAIENCYNIGTVKTDERYKSENRAKILKDEELYADTSGFASGGIIGRVNCWEKDPDLRKTWIKNCWNSGAISSRQYSGGIVGEANNLEVANSYNTGNVTGGLFTGGLVGCMENGMYVHECYDIGNLSGGKMGSIAGDVAENSENIEVVNCYYKSGMTASVSDMVSEGAKALTSQQMTVAESFEGFDFRRIWTLKSGSAMKTPALQFRKILLDKENENK